MSKEVLPIDKQLVENLRLAKSNAEAANKALTEAQLAVFEATKDKLPEKGTTYFTGVKIVTGFYDKWDQDKLLKLQETWTANLKFPFKTEFKPDAVAMKYVKENAPSAYDALTAALTLTDKKPTFELVDIP